MILFQEGKTKTARKMFYWALYGDLVTFIHPFIMSVSHSFHWHLFFPVVPPLIYLPCSALILKSSCSTALMCLVFAESAPDTSWADADMESKNLWLWPLPQPPQCCCVTPSQRFIPTRACWVPPSCSMAPRFTACILHVLSGHLHPKLWRCV